MDAIPFAGKEQGKRDLVVLSNNVRKALQVEAAAIAAEAMTTPVAVAAEAMVTNVHMMAGAAGLATASSIKQSKNKTTPVTEAKLRIFLQTRGETTRPPCWKKKRSQANSGSMICILGTGKEVGRTRGA